MGLDAATLKRLRQEASGFTEKSHKAYVSEALACLRAEGKEPLDALQLLVALWGTYATRDKEQDALNDVGKWLEGRLFRENAGREQIMLELGWLRRMAQVAEATTERDGPHKRNGPRPVLAFGKRVPSLIARRAAQHQEVAGKQAHAAPPPPPPPPAPTELPPVFQAEFVDFTDARNARRTARERVKAGKLPRPRLVPIRPTEPQFVPLAADLVCSVLETEGFSAPFEAAEKKDGAPCSFYVLRVEDRDGKKVAQVIGMTAASEPRG